jgi:UDP-4-amino-4,6-dideoxy-N-acetyl-beta-L-altrosamine N-acetyltransferase
MISFRKLEEKDLQQVLDWRTSKHVTKYMFTDIEYKLENQKKWFEKISLATDEYYWIIEVKEQPIGLISLNELDCRNKKTSFAYYIGNLDFSIIAGRIQPYLYNFIFFELGLNKVCAEVMAGNDGMMKMHRHYGFRHIGTFKDHIYKYEKFHDVEYFELYADEWRGNYIKYHKLKATFVL